MHLHYPSSWSRHCGRAQAPAQPTALPEIQVISTSPFSGGGIDRDKVPALVQTLTAEDISRTL